MNFFSEKDLRGMAENISQNIVVRTTSKSCSQDIKRRTTAEEQGIIFNIAYGALLEARNVSCAVSQRECIQASIDTAEYIINCFLPECNGYETIYLPLKKITKEF